MLAVYYSLRSFSDSIQNSHVKILSDNTTAVATINKMGTSRSKHCNDVAKLIWEFCMEQGTWLTAAHIPGVENTIADGESRRAYVDSEWMLNSLIFEDACRICEFKPDIDLFASRLNAQLDNYVSYRPDPFASYVDAFSLNWHYLKGYIFPPFSLLGKVLQKIRTDKAVALLVAPYWPTQPWFSAMQALLVGEPFIIRPHIDNLTLPNRPSEHHPLHHKLQLIIGKLSG